jgi:hypothetical protein
MHLSIFLRSTPKFAKQPFSEAAFFFFGLDKHQKSIQQQMD